MQSFCDIAQFAMAHDIAILGNIKIWLEYAVSKLSGYPHKKIQPNRGRHYLGNGGNVFGHLESEFVQNQ